MNDQGTVPTHDRTMLRELARQVAEIAALPVQQQTRRQWRALNGLKPERPMVIIDQVCWNEMNVDDELTSRCQDAFARGLETRLRRILYAWKHMRTDMVVEPCIDIHKVFHDDGFGLSIDEHTAAIDPQNDVRGHYYIDQLRTDEDLEKLHPPNITLDRQATAELEAQVRDIFAGLLTVRMQGYEPWFRPWDIIPMWHSVESCLMDVIDRPNFVHRLMQRFSAALFTMLNRLEAGGLLRGPQALIHCTGAWSDELPADGYDPQYPRAKDLWTAGMAQVFSSVSPAMHKEFEIDYAIPWYARFGLGYYGCCEPLDRKLDIVRLLPNLRKVSMSPWVDVERGAAGLGPEYVFSRKPAPALLAADSFDPAGVEADLRTTLEACARHRRPVELILKDISTVRYQPQRLWQWADIAAGLVRG
jgi:hypothetical protein